MFTVFKDESVFSPEHLPNAFLYRDAQMASLQHCLAPAAKKMRPINAFLMGNPATGKTTTIRMALEQLQDASDAICVRVNCSISATTYRILSEAHKKLFGYMPPETGVPLSKLQDSIFNKLSREKRVIIVALDDVSNIKNIEEALYILLRAHESYSNIKIGVLIAATKNDLHKLGDRTRSSFNPEIIKFAPYTKQQIIDILKARASAGLYPNVAPASVIATIAGDAPDVRTAIETLRSAALKAEAEGKKVINVDMLNNQEVSEIEIESDDILKIIKNSAPIDSGKLYDLLSGVSYSKFYRTLKKLEDKGLIRTKEIKKGAGKSRLIEMN